MKELSIINSSKMVKISDEDFNRIKEACLDGWIKIYVNNYGYPMLDLRRLGGKLVTLSRFILQPSRKCYVDHKDFNPLNNTRTNLRLCSKSQNTAYTKSTTSNNHRCKYFKVKYRGVTVVKKTGKFLAQVRKGDKNYYLGCYVTQEEAARAYDKKVVELHGEFARTNFH